MLAELAAANAAFAIIKKCVENGSEIAKAGKAIADFTNHKDEIQRQASSKGSNLDGSKSDLQEFLALDEIKRKESELRSMMQLYGRANMYQDYVKFCAEARKARAEAAKEAKLKSIRRWETIVNAISIIAVIGVGAAALAIFTFVLMEANADVQSHRIGLLSF
jgi:hypothetical protein